VIAVTGVALPLTAVASYLTAVIIFQRIIDWFSYYVG